MMQLQYVEVSLQNLSVVVPGPVGDFLSLSWGGVNLITIIFVLMCASFVLAGLGIGKNKSLAAALILYSIFEYPLSSSLLHYTTNLSFFVFAILTISPSTTTYGFLEILKGPKPQPYEDRWTIPLLMTLLPLAYFNTGVSKLLSGGWDWLNGVRVQTILFERYLYIDSISTLHAAQSKPLCTVIGLATVIGELFFFVVIFSKWARILFVPIALTFHIIIVYVLGINFVYNFCGAMLIYIDYEKVYLFVSHFFSQKSRQQRLSI